VIPSRE